MDSKEPAPVATAPARPGRLALAFSLLAAMLAVGLAVGGYFLWERLQRLDGEQARIAPALERRVEPLQGELRAISRDWQTGRHEIEQQLAALTAARERLSRRLERLAGEVGRSESGWMLAEVAYLLRVASTSLSLRRDIETAREALLAADARLRELADPRVLPVREALARELNALREIPAADRSGIALALSDWERRVGQLPVAGSDYHPPARDARGFDHTRTAGSWKELPGVIWSALKELFRVREHDQPVQPMLPPERAWFLRENLRLQLAAARLALLRDDPALWRDGLATARRWLEQRFDTSAPAVRALLADLETWQGLDIRPELPLPGAALERLRSLRQTLEQPAARVPADEAAAPETVPAAAPRAQPEAAGSGATRREKPRDEPETGTTGSGEAAP
ncbi:MAG TPA: hypothetical protein ENJ79_03560 [Gammaproteobacteria bacterium]|nr:hypothetical protein [Gammaproteobacteria bacterium]